MSPYFATVRSVLRRRPVRVLGAVVAVVLGTVPVLTTDSAQAYQVNGTSWTGSVGGGTSGGTAASTAASGLVTTVTPSGSYVKVNNLTTSPGGTYAATSAMYSPAIAATTPSVQLLVTEDPCTAAVGLCTGLGSVTISFSRPVKDPVLHLAGLGGYRGSGTNYWMWSTKATILSSSPSSPLPTFGTASGQNIVTTASTFETVNPLANTTCSGVFGSVTGSAAAGCGSVPLVGTFSSVTIKLDLKLAKFGNPAAPGTGNGDGWTLNVTVPEDFGDAPASYDPTSAASHVVSDLKLGSAVSVENASVVNGGAVTPSPIANATASADTGDDGVTLPGLNTSMIGAAYNVPVTLSGTSQAGQVCGWIDFNRSGVFDATERACTTFPSGATSLTLPFTVPTATAAGSTVARFRASYNITQVQNPTGLADSGEVEDYPLEIMPAVKVVKLLNPTTDPGRFNLQLNGGTVAANAGHNGTSGYKTVYHAGAPDVSVATNVANAAVSLPVAETGGTGTSVANYTATYACVDGTGASVASGSGSSLTLTIPRSTGTNGRSQAVVCTFTNAPKPATITVNKTLVPSGDSGKFNLAVGATTVATNVGNGGTGSTTAPANQAVTVAEVAGTGTSLSSYGSSLDCVDTGTSAALTITGDSGTSGSITPTANQQVSCTFTNTSTTLPMTKTVAEGSFSAAGNVLNYTITVTNKTGKTLNALTVSDPGATITSCSPANGSSGLANNSSMTCSASRTIVAGDLGSTYVNSATAASSYTTGIICPLFCTTTNVNGAATVSTPYAAMAVTKSTTAGSFSAAGDVLAYTITATNTGTAPLTSVGVTDANATIATCTPAIPVATLAPGASISCSANHTIVAGDLAGSYSNTASTSGTKPGGGTVSATSAAVVTPVAKLAITKAATESSFTAAGDVLHYTITVTNTGTATLTNATVLDPDGALGVCTPALPVATLAPSATISCAATHTVSASELAASFTNNASVSAKDPAGGTVSAATSVTTPVGRLTVAKTTSTASFANAGDTMNFSIVVTNSGTATVSNVTISDPGATLGSCTPALPVASLTVNATITCAASHTAVAGDTASTYRNTATATGTAPGGAAVSATGSVDVPLAKIQLKKESSDATFNAVGDVIHYTITLTNQGSSPVTNASVADSNATIGSCSPALPVATLAAGNEVICSATHTITLDDLGGSYVNTASASATSPSGAALVATAVETTPVTDIGVTKTTTATTYSTVGATIPYTITVTNNGTADVSNVTVSDPNAAISSCTPATPVASLAPGDSVACAAAHTVTQADLDGTGVDNVASATVVTRSGGSLTATSPTVHTAPTQSPALTTSKSSSTASYSAVGAAVAYTITTQNTGNVTLSGVTINDPKATIGLCTPAIPVAALAPGAIVSCAATHTVTQGDLDTGSIVNTATGSGTAPSGSTVTAASPAVTVNATQSPALTVTKTTSTSTYAAVGGTVSFSITARNTGNVTLSNVTVTDANATVGSCSPSIPVATLAPGASITCSASHSVTQADLDTGSVVNIAAASATPPAGGTTSATSPAVTVTATQSPAITTTKSSSTANYATPSDSIVYAVIAQNTGNVTLTNVSVTDANATIGSCSPAIPAASLAPGASITCTATHAASQADLDAGFVDNTAASSGTAPSTATVSHTSAVVRVNAVRSPAISVAKSAVTASYSAVGDTVAFTVTATNSGNQTLSGVTVADANATLGACTPVVPVGGITLAPGDSVSCPATHTATQQDLDAGQIDNVATASATTPTGAPIAAASPAASVNAVQSPAVVVAKSVTSGNYSVLGSPITFSITATNTGNVTLTGVDVTDTGATITSCTPQTPAVSLAPGATVTCSATHVVTQADLDAGTYANTATATGSSPKGVGVSDADTATATATQQPELTTTKTADLASFAHTTDVITYTITARNTGNVTLTNVSVTDANATLGSCSPSLPASLAPQAFVTCTATHAVVQQNIDDSGYANTASASGTAPSSATVSDDGAVTVPADQVSALRVAKSSSTTNYDAVGDTITYSIVVENVGNTTLTSVSVSDANATLGTCSPVTPVASLAPGASITCPATHVVTQTDIDAGSYTNRASAAATGPGGAVTADSPDVVVNAVQNPSLVATKTGSGATYSAVGNTATFTVSVRNDGNVTVSGVTITDPKATLSNCTPSLPVASLAPNATISCTASHTVTQDDLDAGSVDNVATVSGTGPSPTSISITELAAGQVFAAQSPQLDTTKTTSTAPYTRVGDQLDYTIVVTNTGNVTMSLVGVADANATLAACTPAIPVATLAPGATISCPAAHLVTQADLDAGSYSNTATGSGTSPAGPTVSDVSSPAVIAADQTPLLTATKSAITAGYARVGDVLDYSIVVRNAGNVTIHDVTVADPRAVISACVPATPLTLLPGELVTCSASHTVVQADLDAGSYVNTATANGFDPADGATSATSPDATVGATRSPALSTVKSTSTTDYRHLGDTLDYTIVVTNTGNVTASNVTVSDANAAIGTCTPAIVGAGITLVPGASVSCPASHTVLAADLDAGQYVNVAHAGGDAPGGATVADDSDPVTILAIQQAELTTTKTAPVTPYDAVGDVISYTITVENTGNQTLAAVNVTDPGATLGGCTPAVPVASLAVGGTISCDATHTVVQADLDAGSYSNTASAAGTDPNGSGVSDASPPVVVPATRSPELTTTKSTSTANYSAVGASIDYTITVTNSGNVTVSGVTVTDASAVLGVCTPAIGGSGVTLAPAASVSCAASRTVTQADLDAGSYDNTASASGTAPGGAGVSDASPVVTVNAVRSPEITTTKTSPTATYSAVGDPIDYSIVVTNTGNVTVSAITVSDASAVLGSCTPSIAGAGATLAPGATVTCAATHVATLADLDAGSYDNVASASGVGAGGAAVSDASPNVNVPATRSPALTAAKTTPTVSVSAVGAVITYSIVVTNSGNVTVSGVTVTDANATISSCTPSIGGAGATIAPGATVTCAASHATTQDDLDAGSVHNTASASGTAAGGAAVSTTSPDAVVVAVPSPQLTTTKSSPTANYAAVGDPLDYTITVRNTGNVTVLGIGVTDPGATVGTCTPLAPATLAPNDSMTCPASHAATQADLDAGSYSNIATASGTPATGGTVSDASPAVVVPAVQSPQLTTTKSSPTASFSAAGDVITYSITVRNTGNVTISNVGVTDAAATLGACTPVAPATLAPNATITCSASHVASQLDVDSGPYDNVATGSGSAPDASTVSDDSPMVTVPGTATAALTVAKTTSTANYAAVGDALDFTITVTNAGTVTLNGVTVSDARASIMSCTPSVGPGGITLAPGDVITCAAAHTTVQADLDAGSYPNTASATGSKPNGQVVSAASPTVTVPAVQSPSLAAAKSAVSTSFAAPTDLVSFQVTATNNGNVTLTGVSVVDPTATVGSCTPAAPATLAPGAVLTCPVSAAVSQTDLDAGSHVNSASATGTDPTSSTVNAAPASASVPASQNPALTTTKSATSGAFSAVGDVVTFSINVRNSGNVTLTAISVTDTNATIGTCTPVLPVATLAPGASIVCPASHVATQADLDAGAVVNTASAVGTPPTGAAVTGVSPAATRAAAVGPELTTTKSTSATAVANVGEVVSYQLTVENTGNVTLTSVSIADPSATIGTCSPAMPVATFPPGATASCEATHTVTQADVDAGTVRNVATSSGTAPGGATVTSAAAEVTTPATQNPLVDFTKVAKLLDTKRADGRGQIGESVEYTLVATNRGNVTATDVRIEDPMLASMSCDGATPATLAPGAALTCTGTHVISATDAISGKVTNTASLHAFGDCDPSATCPATVLHQAVAAIDSAPQSLPRTGLSARRELGAAMIAVGLGVLFIVIPGRRRELGDDLDGAVS